MAGVVLVCAAFALLSFGSSSSLLPFVASPSSIQLAKQQTSTTKVAPGNVAVCYSPMHNAEYPLNGAGLASQDLLRQAIRGDLRVLSKYVTHIRTYYAQYYGVQVAPIAAEFGLKVYLGVFMTNEGWWSSEVAAAVDAVRSYPGTVEVVLIGSENLAWWQVRASDILAKVHDIKSALGTAATTVKFGTVQRINEYLDDAFNAETSALAANLDILGVDIYPFFTNSYDRTKPAALLDAQWNKMAQRFPVAKMRLMETGFATDGGSNPVAPSVVPSLTDAVGYYQGLVTWTPPGAENSPKFWFMAFDRRADDNSMSGEVEKHFGFFTTDRQLKAVGFPSELVDASVATTPTPAPPPPPSSSSAQPSTTPPSTTAPSTTPPSTTAPTVAPSCIFQVGVDFVGQDVGNAPGSSPSSCCSVCRSRSGCHAFSWSSYNGGTCWLKSAKASTAVNTKIISAVVT
ncbi:TPA: hypothetical protein N0F65_012404 [Lagenidium giganteum]|uniref:glucan endo-1,3-beta-D-glucosidase n=1 Tax=Lagenidium giganteum TaxID=4803 RepID=A0AAV2YMS2_9STRA|nr:TPA: hypothetical protein N0F65_012404 [Lagenidium giganteum]